MWKKLSEEKPPEDGPYLTYVSEVKDLGKYQFIYIANWNMQMDEPEFQDYSGDTTLRDGATVTHWMPMPPRPDELGPERKCQLGVSYDEGKTWHKIDHADEIRGRKVMIPPDETWNDIPIREDVSVIGDHPKCVVTPVPPPDQPQRPSGRRPPVPPPPPRPPRPATTVRRERDGGPYCPKCKSSLVRRGVFGRGTKCISPNCDNFHKDVP